MSYIENITRKEYLRKIENLRTREINLVSLKQFDIFCESTYDEKGDKIIIDLKNHIKKTQDDSNLYRLLQSFVTWLGQDHPELTIKFVNHSRIMKKRSPGTKNKNYEN